MIYILDNGEHYSTHGLYFVDVPAALMKYKEYIEPMMCKGRPWEDNVTIIGTTERIDWLNDGGACEFEGFVRWNAFIDSRLETDARPPRWTLQTTRPNPEPVEFVTRPYVKVPDEVMQYLLDNWRSQSYVSTNDEAEKAFDAAVFNAVEEMWKNGELRP